ncbi:mRNA splicing protein [Malassezia nana]|uniref:Pre-mRNA-splicing factor SLU7 n=1 Tax=Malassezia nana TaxID=180528 RepID=A0AAF0EIS1_9BASI|nr:mRNA splicing protein [Malassezia nana]
MSDDRFRDAFRPRETDAKNKPKIPQEEVNPNVPLYMAQTPWYLNTGGNASMEHQRKPPSAKASASLDDWYQRGAVSGPASKRFRKGACENCGAMSHKTKDCLERPRKRGARWTGKDIRPDEVVQSLDDLEYNYDAKRDRWNGYDPASHLAVVERYEAVEEERRKIREQEEAQQAAQANEAKTTNKEKRVHRDDDFDSSDSDDDDDEEKYADKASMVGQKMDADKRLTIRNLRIREDRAKYLYNLSTESAHYDPKTRSMREAPNPGNPLDLDFDNETFEQSQGDQVNMQKMQLFAWQAEQRGDAIVNMQANPTVHELQYKEASQRKEKEASEVRSSILERYGGVEHLDAMPRELRAGQTEAYVEYSRTGEVIRGPERIKPRSRYEEDVYENNHTSVWGSWYDMARGVWGYACCHNTLPRSYCTGEAGKEAYSASLPA